MKPKIAITMGDPAGIGPEIIAKTLGDLDSYRVCNPLVIGDGYAMQMGIDVARQSLKIRPIEKPSQAMYQYGTIDLVDLHNLDPNKIEMGKAAPMTGAASAEYVIHAADLALAGSVDAIVTAPLNKEAMHMGGYNYPGLTLLPVILPCIPQFMRKSGMIIICRYPVLPEEFCKFTGLPPVPYIYNCRSFNILAVIE